MKSHLIFIGCMLAASFLEAAPFSAQSEFPLGKRIYIIKNSNSPVSIKRKSTKIEKGVSIMRDPIIPNDNDIRHLNENLVLPPKTKVAETLPAKLRFKQKSILGRYAIPRMEFKSEMLTLSRVDQKIKIDTIGNIFRTNEVIEQR